MLYDSKGYIYRTENLINHKTYIGQHAKEEFDPYYYGSGVKIKKELDKYGKENFKVTILKICDVKDLDKEETLFVQREKELGHAEYNLTKTGRLTHNSTIIAKINSMIFICPYCQKQICSKGNLTQHVRAKHKNKYKEYTKNKSQIKPIN